MPPTRPNRSSRLAGRDARATLAAARRRAISPGANRSIDGSAGCGLFIAYPWTAVLAEAGWITLGAVTRPTRPAGWHYRLTGPCATFQLGHRGLRRAIAQSTCTMERWFRDAPTQDHDNGAPISDTSDAGRSWAWSTTSAARTPPAGAEPTFPPLIHLYMRSERRLRLLGIELRHPIITTPTASP